MVLRKTRLKFSFYSAQALSEIKSSAIGNIFFFHYKKTNCISFLEPKRYPVSKNKCVFQNPRVALSLKREKNKCYWAGRTLLGVASLVGQYHQKWSYDSIVHSVSFLQEAEVKKFLYFPTPLSRFYFSSSISLLLYKDIFLYKRLHFNLTHRFSLTLFIPSS